MNEPDGNRGLGLYIHFPYCVKRCIYCDFNLTTPKTIPAAAYTDGLIRELGWRLDPSQPIHVAARTSLRSLYVGGGTPSLWPRDELGRFLRAVAADLPLEAGAEVTLEANPEEVNAGMIDELVALGVNRVSLGVQSLDEAELIAMSRAHGRTKALQALELLAAAHAKGRLASYSVDLIYGLPGQSGAAWEAGLREVIERFDPPHLSLYALTVEPRTVLALKVRKSAVAAPEDELQMTMMFRARDLLAARGYTHYEISSWAKPGQLAVHNSGYWELRPYLALGAGAHGFIDGQRYRNEGRPSRYLERVQGGGPEVSVERPEAATLRFERLMTGLRRLDRGLELTAEDRAIYASVIAAEITRGRLVEVGEAGEAIRLTDEGVQFMDDVLLGFVP